MKQRHVWGCNNNELFNNIISNGSSFLLNSVSNRGYIRCGLFSGGVHSYYLLFPVNRGRNPDVNQISLLRGYLRLNSVLCNGAGAWNWFESAHWGWRKAAQCPSDVIHKGHSRILQLVVLTQVGIFYEWILHFIFYTSFTNVFFEIIWRHFGTNDEKFVIWKL